MFDNQEEQAEGDAASSPRGMFELLELLQG
jgi:hypothetical protein